MKYSIIYCSAVAFSPLMPMCHTLCHGVHLLLCPNGSKWRYSELSDGKRETQINLFFCWQNELGMKKTFLKAQLTSALQYAQSTTFFIYINRSDQHPHANKRSQLSNYQKLKLQQGLKYRLNFNSNKLLVWAFDTCSNLTNT